MADRTDYIYEIRCRTDISESPWVIKATRVNKSDFLEMTYFHQMPSGDDIEEFMEWVIATDYE